LTNLTLLDRGEWKNTAMKGFKIGIDTIPAVHGISPLSAFFAGKGNGYLLTITKGEDKARIYITGDTVYKKRIIDAIGNRPIDLMIANMGAAMAGSWIMTLTLNAKMLKKMISALQPKTVIPVHYGTYDHYREPVEKIEKLKDERIKPAPPGFGFRLPFLP
jgi:L-ascorbate metabolism protein UlaG (beta-lactamase superfamily)